MPRQKAAGKVGIAPDAADDGIDGNILQPARRGVGRLEFLANLLIVEELGGRAGQARHDLLEFGSPARAPKIQYG